MKLLRLSLCNFGPFAGVQEIDFDGRASVVIVTAEYAGAKGKSNRAGKSSVFDAIFYAMYGKCRVKETEWIHYGASSMYVELTLDLGGQQLTIKRGRTSKNDPIFEVNGVAGPRLQEEIDRRLGISYSDFVSTNYFKQLDMHSFMEAKPAEKQKMLAQWLGNDYWAEYEELAKKQVKLLETQLAELKTRELVLIAQQVVVSDMDVINAQDAMNKAKAELSSLQTKKEALWQAIAQQQAHADKHDLNTRVAENTSKIADIKRTIQYSENQITSYMAWKNTVDTNVRAIASIEAAPGLSSGKQASELLKIAEDKNRTLNNRISEFNTQIRVLQLAATGICPVLKEECSRVSTAAMNPLIAPMQEELTKAKSDLTQDSDILLLRNIIKDSDRLNTQLSSAKAEAVRLAIDGRSLIKVTEYENGLINLNAQLTALTLMSLELKSEEAKLQPKTRSLEEREIEVVERVLLTTQERVTSTTVKYQQLLDGMEKNRKLYDEITKLKATLMGMQQDLSDLIVLQYVFSKNGVPLVQIENAFQQLEAEINAILEALCAECRVVFQASKELTTKETECAVCSKPYQPGEVACASCGAKRKHKRKDDMAVRLVYRNGVESDFEADSGGGKALISLAVRPALARVLQRRQQYPCNLLLLDEVFANFDQYNRDMVMDALFKLFVEKFHFEQIFVITHTDVGSYGYPFDELRVVKDDLASKVSWV